jgi:isocitrate/isopropylmalate dehydrogenase
VVKRTIVTMPGDGIGKVVLPEAVRVLNAVKFDADYVHGDIGWDFWIHEGNALPPRTIELLEQHKIGLRALGNKFQGFSTATGGCYAIRVDFEKRPQITQHARFVIDDQDVRRLLRFGYSFLVSHAIQA